MKSLYKKKLYKTNYLIVHKLSKNPYSCALLLHSSIFSVFLAVGASAVDIPFYAFIFAGLFVGFVVGLTGVGGGSLMTPILIFIFGVKPSLAVGTDLLFAAATKFFGVSKLAKAKHVDWKIVASLCAGSVPAALLSVYALHHLNRTGQDIQSLITSTLGVALLLTAAATLYKAIKGKKQGVERDAAAVADPTRPRHWALPILFGALIGTLVSLTSVGAGAIGVTVLMLLYPALPLPRSIAADLAYAVPLTLVAGLGHASIGEVDWRLLGLLLAGSIPGIWLGAHLVTRTPDRIIRSLLSVLLAYAGVKLLAL